jgi:hypothetical protein
MNKSDFNQLTALVYLIADLMRARAACPKDDLSALLQRTLLNKAVVMARRLPDK